MEELYRGYRIRPDQSYEAWRLWVNPIHPHLPILQHPQFVCDGPIDGALRDARSRVDALLRAIPNAGLAALFPVDFAIAIAWGNERKTLWPRRASRAREIRVSALSSSRSLSDCPL